MSKRAKVIQCSREERNQLEKIAQSGTEQARLVNRARMVVGCLDRRIIHDIAKEFKVLSNTVIKWRDRFVQEGIRGLEDRPRSGKPITYDSEFRNKVLKLLDTDPPKGQTTWDGPAIAKELKTSVDAVWRLLRKEGICLRRPRSWCTSTDPEFVPKSADIIGLYLNPPENAIVISVDEKPSIQALERSTGYVYSSSRKIVRGFKSTYKRHGTLNLFAALEIATGAIRTMTTELKRRVEFLEFMDRVVADMPEEKEIHVILDNYCIHKKNDLWLSKHPNVHFHYTPTSASWLNMVEIWFGMFSRKALRGADCKSISDLRHIIEEYIEAYGPTAKPFIWRKREVKGSQLRNTIANLCY